jgi:hypothetical protein
MLCLPYINAYCPQQQLKLKQYQDLETLKEILMEDFLWLQCCVAEKATYYYETSKNGN